MADIELAEPFADEFGEVVIVVDIGKELAVGLSHLGPVDAVESRSVEALENFARNVVEHEFAFGCVVEFETGR